MIENITRRVTRIVRLDSDGDGSPDAKGAVTTLAVGAGIVYALALTDVIKSRRIRKMLPGISPYRRRYNRRSTGRRNYRRNNYRRY